MSANEFIAVFERLLRDGALRDALAADPSGVVARLGVTESALAAILQLSSEDLEFQARVLLRKRFASLSDVLPQTWSRLGEASWPTFHQYARDYWPAASGGDLAAMDARDFCEYLARHRPAQLCDAESNRARFALSTKRLSAHWVRLAVPQGNSRPALQLLFRVEAGNWREMIIYIGACVPLVGKGSMTNPDG